MALASLSKLHLDEIIVCTGVSIPISLTSRCGTKEGVVRFMACALGCEKSLNPTKYVDPSLLKLHPEEIIFWSAAWV